ncbi:MAG TPA: ParB N-terminal domain-containing protein [Acidimicrobiales bacterium]|nr:ParB N-terminal domain-containing protein [Acidimicrobiales bacterium]
MADPTSVQMLPLAALEFDPENPRLPRGVDTSDFSEVLEWMLRDASLVELMGSIGGQGYFAGEPVLVCPARTGGKLLVVEGNRRLAATLLLNNPSLAPVRKHSVEEAAAQADQRPQELPAIVFPLREEILNYLGYRHVTGVKQWTPLAKARYLAQLRERAKRSGQDGTDRQLALLIGSRSDYVRKLLTGLEVYDHIVNRDFYDLKGVDEESISFAVLTTALSYERIAEWVGVRAKGERSQVKLDDKNLKRLVDWTFRELPNRKTVVGESRNLKKLAAVVASPRAVKALLEGRTLDEAALFTDEPLNAFRAVVEEAVGNVGLARDMTPRLTRVEDYDVDRLKELVRMVRELHRVVEDRLGEEDDEP